MESFREKINAKNFGLGAAVIFMVLILALTKGSQPELSENGICLDVERWNTQECVEIPDAPSHLPPELIEIEN